MSVFPPQILEEFSLIGPDANVESEPETNECQDAVADRPSILPKEGILAEKRSPPTLEPIAESVPASNPTEMVVEAPTKDSSLVEVPTAPTVPQTIEEDHAIENDSPLLHPESGIESELKMEMAAAGGQEKPPKNQIIYALYRQRLTNDASPKPKRPLLEHAECSTPKRSKQVEPDIIVLD